MDFIGHFILSKDHSIKYLQHPKIIKYNYFILFPSYLVYWKYINII